MTNFRLNMSIDKWIYQNKGECIDCFEGCLLDNVLIACKNGTAAIFERYLNPNASCYEVYFSRNDEAMTLFYNRMESADA